MDSASTSSMNYCIHASRDIEKFDGDPNLPNAATLWIHWCNCFTSFLIKDFPSGVSDSTKLQLLSERLSPTLFDFIRVCKSYTDAMKILNNIYMKPRNEVLSRYILGTRKQQQGESIADYIRVLKLLAADCNFRDITAEEHAKETIKDAFIAGTSSHNVKQHLLKNTLYTLDEILNMAISVESTEIEIKSIRSSLSNASHEHPGTSDIKSDANTLKPKRFVFWNKLRAKIHKSCVKTDV